MGALILPLMKPKQPLLHRNFHPLKNSPRVSMSKKLNNGPRQQLTRRLPSRKLKKRLKMKRRLLMKPVTRRSKRRPRRSENQDFPKIWTDLLILRDGFHFDLEVISRENDAIENTRLEKVIKVLPDGKN